MAISKDLFLAILALDSYNRGYNVGVSGLSDNLGTEIGSARISGRPMDPTAAASIGFYATAYDWNGETIISYRGTDNFGPFESTTAGASDIWTGWSLALGFLNGTQATHAPAAVGAT